MKSGWPLVWRACAVIVCVLLAAAADGQQGPSNDTSLVSTTTDTAVTPATGNASDTPTTAAATTAPFTTNATTQNTTQNTTDVVNTTMAPMMAPTMAPQSRVRVIPTRLCTLKYRISGSLFASLLGPAYRQQLVNDIMTDIWSDLQLFVEDQVSVQSLDLGSLNITADINATNASAVASQLASIQSLYLTASHDFPSLRSLYFTVNPTSTETIRTLSIEMSNVLVIDATAAPSSTSTCGAACGVYIALTVGIVVATAAVALAVVLIRRASGSQDKKPAAPPTKQLERAPM